MDSTTTQLVESQQQLQNFSQTVYAGLQQDYHELNHDIPKDSPLEAFRHEYAKLFSILQKSMTNQTRYIEKARVLESEIAGNKAKIKAVIKLGEEDARSIAALNDEKDKKQAYLNEARNDLQMAMEENQQLTDAIASRESDLEKCVADERSQKDFLRQLKGRRAELKKDLEGLNEQIPILQEQNRKAAELLASKDKEIEASLAELDRIREMVEIKRQEDRTERQRLFELERDRDATKVRLAEAKEQAKERQNELKEKQDTLKNMEKRSVDVKRQFETAKSERQSAIEKLNRLQKDLDNAQKAISNGDAEIQEAQGKLDSLQKQLADAQKRLAKQETERSKIQKKQQTLLEEFQGMRNESDAVKLQINATQDQIEGVERQIELVRKQIDACTRDENVKNRQRMGEEQKQSTAESLIQMYANQAHNIDCEIEIVKAHLQETQKKIFVIEQERDSYNEELAQSATQHLHALDVLREIESSIETKNGEIQEAQKKVMQQQALYEQVRSKREVSAKKVKEIQADIKLLEQEFNRMKFTIEQHKEDIRRKERERVIDMNSLDDLKKEEIRLRERLSEVQVETNTALRAITAHEGEIGKLEKAIKDADQQLELEMRKLREVKHDRDQMSNQNVQREMELQKLDEKLTVLRNQVRRGERDYDVKESEIIKLRAQIERDQKRLDELSKLDDTLKQRRQETHQLQKELLRLKAERAAMEEELAVPINIHRWTLLESGDPERFEKLNTYQELQAQLVKKTREAVALQDQVKAKEEEYAQLVAQARRRAGLEALQTAEELKDVVKSEQFSLDQINTQLEICRDSVRQYKKELSEVQADLAQQRNHWIKQKKRDIKNRQRLQEQQDILDQLGIDVSLN